MKELPHHAAILNDPNDWRGILSIAPLPFSQKLSDLIQKNPVSTYKNAILQYSTGTSVLDGTSFGGLLPYGDLIMSAANTANDVNAMQTAEGFDALITAMPDAHAAAAFDSIQFAASDVHALQQALDMSRRLHSRHDEMQRHYCVVLNGSRYQRLLSDSTPGFLPLFTFSPADYPALSPQHAAEEAGDALAHLLDQYPGQIQSMLLEPLLVRDETDIHIYDAIFLQRVRELCDVHGIHVIFDESFSGMGRCSPGFVYQTADVMPDILCASSGLTRQLSSLACCLYTAQFKKILQQVKDIPVPDSALANELINTQQHFKALQHAGRLEQLSAAIAQRLTILEKTSGVKSISQLGALARIDLDRPVSTTTDDTVLLYTSAQSIYWLPAYCTTDDQLDALLHFTNAIIQ